MCHPDGHLVRIPHGAVYRPPGRRTPLYLIFCLVYASYHLFLAEAELVTARHELEMRDMDRRLREEQDLEFQRTMEADRKRIEEENKKKQEEEDKIRAAEEKANERIRRVTEHRVRNFTRFHSSFTQCQPSLPIFTRILPIQT